MSTKIFVWKNPKCDGKNIEWLELSYEEFLELKHDKANSSRNFISIRKIEKNDDSIIIESTKEEYDKWNYENMSKCRNEAYKRNHNYTEISLQQIIETAQESNWTLESIISDNYIDVENDSINSLELNEKIESFNSLSDSDKDFIQFLYESLYNHDTFSDIARSMGVSRNTIYRRLNRIKEKVNGNYK